MNRKTKPAHRKKKMSGKTPRRFALLGSASGGGAIAGAHNVCHAICVGLASFLAVFGVTVSSTALMFMQDYAPYFWSMGLAMLIVSLVMYERTGFLSRKLTIANTGLLIASVPFIFLESYLPAFWITGGALVVLALAMLVNERWNFTEVIR